MLGADWDRVRVDYALRQHEQWYKGDGTYGDGPDFHWDYYNSLVIHPAAGRPRRLWRGVRRLGRELCPVTERAQALRRRPGTPHLSRRHVPADRPFACLSLRRLPPPRPDGAAPGAAARRSRPRSARRAHRGHQTHHRGPGHLRRPWLAAHRLLPAISPESASATSPPAASILRRRPAPARPARRRSLLVGAVAALDAKRAWSGQAFPIDKALEGKKKKKKKKKKKC